MVTAKAICAITTRYGASAGTSAPIASASTIATAATEPTVDSQSFQPTRKPEYPPSARRTNTY